MRLPFILYSYRNIFTNVTYKVTITIFYIFFNVVTSMVSFVLYANDVLRTQIYDFRRYEGFFHKKRYNRVVVPLRGLSEFYYSKKNTMVLTTLAF